VDVQAEGPVERRVDLGSSGAPSTYRAATRVLDSRTAFPIGLLALQMEQVWVDQGLRALRSLSVKVLGVVTDGIFFQGGEEAVRRFVEENPTFALKSEPGAKVPKVAQTFASNDRPRPRPERPWLRLPEGAAQVRQEVLSARRARLARKTPFLKGAPAELVGEFLGERELRSLAPSAPMPACPLRLLAELPTACGGALVTGPAGTGKTLFASLLMEHWRRLEPEVVFVPCALTHVAARLLAGGRTIRHVMSRRRNGTNLQGTVLVVDEISMVPMATLAVMARYQRMGARFVCLGDFAGQFQPIADAWPGDVAGSGLLRELCRSLHVELRTNRRAPESPEHYGFYTSLYPLADLPLQRPLLEEVAARYPWGGTDFDLALTVSHYDRRRVNAWANRRREPTGMLVYSRGYIRGASSQPQDMLLRRGVRLLGAGSRRVLNGVEYVVSAVDDETVRVDMAEPFRTPRAGLSGSELLLAQRAEDDVALTHLEAWQNLRLRYAMCYATIQGRTVREQRILLLGCRSRYFTARTLIVGLSRATDGAMVCVPTAEEEAELRRTLPDVPDERFVDEEEENEESD
jgi:hypothetical protein